jgi:hypothetical protein
MATRDNYQAENADISSPQKEALDSLALSDGQSINIHMVHLNHLDLTWYWRLPDTIEVFPNGLAYNELLITLSTTGVTKKVRVSRAGLVQQQ